MDARRPAPTSSIPFWAKREFRWLILFSLLTAACIGVLVFEIGPVMMNRRPVRRAVATASAKPSAPRSILFDGMLDGVKDATPLPEEDADAPYRYLLGYLRNVDQDTLAKQSRAIDYGRYFDAPDQVRGQVARVTGVLTKVDPFRPEPGGEIVYRVYLVDGWASQAYVADLVEKPSIDTPDAPAPRFTRPTVLLSENAPAEKPRVDAPAASPARPTVQVEGIFLKVATYESRGGPLQAPLLLGRTLRPVVRKEAPAGVDVGHVLTGLAGLAFAGAMGLTVLVLRNSARPRLPRAPSPRSAAGGL